MAERIINHYFEVKANKIEQFIRNIPDYAENMHAKSSDAPGYILFKISGLHKGDFRKLHKIENYLNKNWDKLEEMEIK